MCYIYIRIQQILAAINDCDNKIKFTKTIQKTRWRRARPAPTRLGAWRRRGVCAGCPSDVHKYTTHVHTKLISLESSGARAGHCASTRTLASEHNERLTITEYCCPSRTGPAQGPYVEEAARAGTSLAAARRRAAQASGGGAAVAAGGAAGALSTVASACLNVSYVSQQMAAAGIW